MKLDDRHLKSDGPRSSVRSSSAHTPLHKPDGPRSDSRRHRVGLVRLLFLPHRVPKHAPQQSYASRPLVSGRCCSASDSRPGPASARSARPSPCEVDRTDGCPRVVLAAAHPNGVAERFPDWTAVGFRSRPHRCFRPARMGLGPTRTNRTSRCSLPDPFLGSRALDRTSVRRWGPMGPTLRVARNSLPRCDSVATNQTLRPDPQLPRVTGGDSNPTCLWILADPLVPGGLRLRSCDRSSWGSLPCRWPPASALPAFGCFAGHSLLESRTPFWEPFSFSAGHFRVRRRREIYAAHLESRKFFDIYRFGYPPVRANI